LQPDFYYSDVFVTPIRSDLDKLLAGFAKCLLNGSDQHGIRGLSSNAADQTGIPPDCNSFAIFKTCWVSSNWSLMHLRCLDAIGRVAFLHVLHRMFLEASLSCSDNTMRLGALYGLYTFYMTQPTQLHKITHVPVPLVDDLLRLFQLPLNFEHPHKLVATHLITTLISQKVFSISPRSDLRPLNPTTLPQ
ncbi:hypothetical protein BDV93DRAFT_410797, partial [Ceratobasidium sp. AG-I]